VTTRFSRAIGRASEDSKNQRITKRRHLQRIHNQMTMTHSNWTWSTSSLNTASPSYFRPSEPIISSRSLPSLLQCRARTAASKATGGWLLEIKLEADQRQASVEMMNLDAPVRCFPVVFPNTSLSTTVVDNLVRFIVSQFTHQ
jgi:hypothetical protein